MSPGATVRLRRYARDPRGMPPFVLQRRDEDIVRTVATHRVISSEELTLLMSGSRQGVLRRLQALFHGGYLDRPRVQRVSVRNRPMLYALGQRGAELVRSDENRRRVDWSEKNRELGAHFIEHTWMISRVRTAVILAAARSKGAVTLDAWCGDRDFRDAVTVQSGGTAVRVPIVPDAFVTLGVHTEPIGRIRLFLEADRGTTDLKRFVMKMRGYQEYWRTGAAMESLGARNFLVATVARTPQRARSLAEACRDVGSDLRMFVFTSEPECRPVDSGRIFEMVWRTPDDERHSLLE